MIRPAGQSLKSDSAQLAPQVLSGLQQLARGLDYARDLHCSVWDFAVEIERLLAMGVTTSDLRWLVKRGYVSHAREVTTPQDPERHFDPAEPNPSFAKNSCFVLTEAGLAILDREHSHSDHEDDEVSAPLADSSVDLPARELATRDARRAAIPNWDRDTRTFLVGQDLIKRFRVPSANQEAVLDAFQEEGWPPSIDDPLPPSPDLQPKRRLHDTIKCLNLNQVQALIRFRGDGTGQRVLWELLPASAALAGGTARPHLHRVG